MTSPEAAVVVPLELRRTSTDRIIGRFDPLGPQEGPEAVHTPDGARCLTNLTRLLWPALAGHQRRTSKLSGLVAEALGLEPAHVAAVALAGAMHDVGKLPMIDILSKPGRLTPEEMVIMRQHTEHGHRILRDAGDPTLQLAAQVALEHHERWVGGGYPRGLKGEEISREARIVAVCDVYDALREVRPYKVPVSHEQAMGILLCGDGRVMPDMFDPDVLAAVVRCSERMREVYSIWVVEECSVAATGG